jgi:hypothetical protein
MGLLSRTWIAGNLAAIMSSSTPDLRRLLQLRAAVARFGEMDAAKWWNTRGQLGRFGAAALRRGFPRTHPFARARSVFAVAAHRCAEVFEPPGCVTLWRLSGSVEASFDAAWEGWLDDVDGWAPFFARLEPTPSADLASWLLDLGLVSAADVESASRLRASAEGRAVALSSLYAGSDADVTLLALGFARGAPGALAVPYARRSDA